MNKSNFVPMPISEGPPLPQLLNVRWPWLPACPKGKIAIKTITGYPDGRKVKKWECIPKAK